MRTKINSKSSHMRTFKRDIMDEAEYVIGKHCGVTFAGIKPASLVSLHREGKDVMRFLAHKFRRRGFSFVVMRERRERIAVYVYHGEQLRGVLFSKEVREFLFSLGYRYGSAEEAVSQLRADGRKIKWMRKSLIDNSKKWRPINVRSRASTRSTIFR